MYQRDRKNGCICPILQPQRRPCNNPHLMNQTRYSQASSRSDAVYPYFIFPDKGTAIYPYRRSGIPATPVEGLLAGCLEKALANSAFEVITGGCFKFAEGGYTYRASILLCDRENKGVAIDVEIDEPYTLPDFTPRHYIEDSSDSLRDSLLTARGWAVVRFAEKQVVESCGICCNFVLSLINSLKLFPPIPYDSSVREKPSSFRRFSRVSAELAARTGLREGYLGRAGLESFETAPYADREPLTPGERASLCGTDADGSLGYESGNNEGYNAEHHFDRDDDIVFIPETHTYLYKGCDAMKSVTTVVSELFSAFDAHATAERKAREEQCSPNVFLDKWAFASREAAETGTHMHAQIENWFLGRKTNSSFRLRFDSPTVRCDKYVDVGREFSYFLDFIIRAGIKPYRTEWPIYDAEARIAGSPDLVAEKNGKLLMFDWKRSTKVVDAGASPGINGKPNMKCWNRHGFGAYSPLPDCAFVHYSLQQAVYKRILAKNYGVSIDRTFLVVLHPQYSHFYIVETMDVEKYVDRIFSSVR